MMSGLLGHACEAMSASRPARPGGRAGPAAGARGVWGRAGPTPLIGPAREGRPVLARPVGCVRRPVKPGGQVGSAGGRRQARPTRLLGLLLLLASWAKKMDRPQAGPDGFSIFLIHFLSFSISFSLLFYLLPIWLGFDLFSFMY